MEGYLWKKGKRFGSYKKRFFTISGMTLSYRESQEPSSKGKGFIDLTKVKYFSACADGTRHRKVGWFSCFALELVTDSRTWVLIPEVEQERNAWVDALVKILPPHFVARDLQDMSAARARAAAPPDESKAMRSPVGKPAKKRLSVSTTSSDEEDFPVVRKPSRGPAPAPAAEMEMIKAEVERLKKQNDEYAKQLESDQRKPAPRRVGKGPLQKPLLDGDGSGQEEEEEEDTGPSACSRCCTFVCVNIGIITVISTNAVLLVFGAVFMGLSVWLQKNLKNFKGLLGAYGEDGVYACMALGVFLALVSILGMVGVCKRRTAAGRCMLYIFAITMFMVVALEATTSALMFTSSGVHEASDAMNAITQTCCKNGTYTNQCSWLPQSVVNCNVSDDNYTEFRSQVKAYIKSKVTTLAIIATAIVVVEVGSICYALKLVCDGKRLMRGSKKQAQKSNRVGRTKKPQPKSSKRRGNDSP